MTDERPDAKQFPRVVRGVYTKDSAFVDPKSPVEVQKLVAKSEYRNSARGMVAGVVCVLLGVVLSILGVSGSITWIVKAKGLESSLSNAAPGALLAVVGVVIIFVTRAKFVHKKP